MRDKLCAKKSQRRRPLSGFVRRSKPPALAIPRRAYAFLVDFLQKIEIEI